MRIISKISELRDTIKTIKNDGKTIGLVPTMGALHLGHLSLVSQSVAHNNVTVVSVFVNPTQFNNKEDLRNYPRTLEQDAKILSEAGCDILFAPESSEIYTEQELQETFDFDFKGLDLVMEGKFRPGHFNGVVQIVSKLFSLVEPDRAYFGQKDFQQLAIIRLMVNTYGLGVEIVACPIVREDSGLALSSRNALLEDNDRLVAPHIFAVLKESLQFVPSTPVEELKECVVKAIEQNSRLRVEYFEIVDGVTLQPIKSWEEVDYVVGCITVYCGKIRLIDNIKYK